MRLGSADDAARGMLLGTPMLAGDEDRADEVVAVLAARLRAELGTGSGDEIRGTNTAIVAVAS